jgi:hypothetical protein
MHAFKFKINLPEAFIKKREFFIKTDRIPDFHEKYAADLLLTWPIMGKKEFTIPTYDPRILKITPEFLGNHIQAGAEARQ